MFQGRERGIEFQHMHAFTPLVLHLQWQITRPVSIRPGKDWAGRLHDVCSIHFASSLETHGKTFTLERGKWYPGANCLFHRLKVTSVRQGPCTALSENAARNSTWTFCMQMMPPPLPSYTYYRSTNEQLYLSRCQGGPWPCWLAETFQGVRQESYLVMLGVVNECINKIASNNGRKLPKQSWNQLKPLSPLT